MDVLNEFGGEVHNELDELNELDEVNELGGEVHNELDELNELDGEVHKELDELHELGYASVLPGMALLHRQFVKFV